MTNVTFGITIRPMSSEHRIPGLRPSELAATSEQRQRNETVYNTLNSFRATLLNNEAFKKSLAGRFLDPHVPELGRQVTFLHNGTIYTVNYEPSISNKGKYRMELDISVDPDITDGLRDVIKLGSTAFHPLDATYSYLQESVKDEERITNIHPNIESETDPFDKIIARSQEVITALSTPPRIPQA